MQALITPLLLSIGPSCPIECAFLNNPDVSYDQDTKKHQHLSQSEEREFSVDDGPGEKKNSFNVENDKKNRDHVIADCVTLPGVGIRIHAAFVRSEFAPTTGLRTDQSGDQQSHDWK